MSIIARVELEVSVLRVCMRHALTTSKEEVMGLLIGSTDRTRGVVRVSSVVLFQRSDIKSDRVEVDPSDLVQGSAVAEVHAEAIGSHVHVCGWYHSHPKITFPPSAVDLRSQAMYQSMEAAFIGLIFPVFHTTNNISERCHVYAFQAEPSSMSRIDIPVHIVPDSLPYWERHNLLLLARLDEVLYEEELEKRGKCVEDQEQADRQLFHWVRTVREHEIRILDLLDMSLGPLAVSTALLTVQQELHKEFFPGASSSSSL
jgi:BRCA1/BRCA2-containing complex subunit 3